MDGKTKVCQLVDPPLVCSINFAYVLNICQGFVVSIYIKMWNTGKVSVDALPTSVSTPT